MTYSAEVLADSPLAYYRLGDPSGTTCTDSSGNARNMTYTASPTLAVAGALLGDADTAVTFNGTTQYASIASAAWMNGLTAFTIEAWVKTTTAAAGARVFARAANPANYGLGVGGGKAFVEVNTSVGGSQALVGAVTVNDGNWHHIVGVWVSGVGLRLYVDGVADGTLAKGGTLNTGSNALRIAQRNSDLFFAGTVDEAAVYGTDIGATRIAAHYTAGVSASATVTVPVATATAAAVVPSVTGGGLVVPAATATATAIAPVVSAHATVSPPAATATATALVPVIDVPGDVTVLVPTATATAEALAPTLTWSATVTPPAGTATAEGVVPTITATANQTVTVPVAAATAEAIAPFISNDSPDATITVPRATATATALAPVVVQVLPSGTDTTNLSGGRVREATGAVTITRPVEAVPVSVGTRVDKALAYPAPTMVDGRPT